jgi:hypothetical protein
MRKSLLIALASHFSVQSGTRDVARSLLTAHRLFTVEIDLSATATAASKSSMVDMNVSMLDLHLI